MVSLRAIVRSETTQEKIQQAQEKIEKLDARRAEINAQKEEIKQDLLKLKEEKVQIADQLGFEYLIDLNAKRRTLSKLLGKDVSDLEIPGQPTFADKAMYWTPRVAGAVALTAAGAYVAPYAKPYVMPYAGPAGAAVASYATGALNWVKGLFEGTGSTEVELKEVEFTGKDGLSYTAMVHKDLASDAVSRLANTPSQYVEGLQIKPKLNV